MVKLVRIPQRFIIDCSDCDCEVPDPVHSTKKHFWISTKRDDLMDELIGRALLYSNTMGWNQEVLGLCYSARFTLIALAKANVLTDYELKRCNAEFGYSHV